MKRGVSLGGTVTWGTYMSNSVQDFGDRIVIIVGAISAFPNDAEIYEDRNGRLAHK